MSMTLAEEPYPGAEALCGWLDQPEQVQLLTSGYIYKSVQEVLDDNGLRSIESLLEDKKTVVLAHMFRQLPNNGGKDVDWGPQAIGDCVSWGWGGVTDMSQAAAIIIGKKPWEFQATSREYIYGSSRVEIGGQRGSRSDGSVGAWAAEGVKKFGAPSRKALADAAKDNALLTYSGSRAKDWGANGVPDSLEPVGQKHYFKEVVMVTTFEEAAAMIYLGKAVAVCSTQGFSQSRDSEGFCRTSMMPWPHCMYFAGVRWDRPGLLCTQSWGQQSPTGPKAFEQPDNSFWVQDTVTTSMLRRKDSYAPADFMGYEAADALGYYNF